MLCGSIPGKISADNIATLLHDRGGMTKDGTPALATRFMGAAMLLMVITVFTVPAHLRAEDIGKKAAKDGVLRAAAAEAADARAAALFRDLSAAKTKDAQETAIASLHAMVTSKSPEEHEAVCRFAADLSTSSGDAKKLAEVAGRRELLTKDIPILIETLDGNFRNKAWWILLALRPSSLPPSYAQWQTWWKETGKDMFAPVPVAVAAPDGVEAGSGGKVKGKEGHAKGAKPAK